MNVRHIMAALIVALAPSGAFADGANSQSSVQNSTSPQAVVNQQTGGGVNLNQQYNNQWDNHSGFAPGVYCRTPTFYIGSGFGYADSNAGSNGANTSLTQVSAGVLVPFGSTVLEDCKRMATALTDRAEVANQVALVRVCAELVKDKIIVDPIKFPALAKCVN
jgi:hypothetical protein